MRMGQGVRTGLGHGGITCVLQTQFSSFDFFFVLFCFCFFFLLLILEKFHTKPTVGGRSNKIKIK